MKNPFSKKAPSQQEAFLRIYLDRIAPGVVKFEVDHYIFGSTYRCVWALREYPASTEAQALLRELGEKSGVTLRIYCRQVSPGEEDRIIDNANKKNKLDGSDPNKLRQAVAAESNLRDVAELVHKMHREHEPLVHCAVYLEMTADSKERLRQLQTDILTELVRRKLNVDKLLLRQKQGFCCVSPVGSNVLGREFERVLPASSVANLYPFNYSGKTDPNGFYIGKDKYGSNIVVDFDRRDSDKTSANILILGNSGQGKSYLIKLLICNLLEAGKSVIALDAEHELEELCENLGGCFIDLMAGEKRINVLEVRSWNEDADSATDETVPEAFRKSTLLARHISFLKDFFRAYKDFSDPQLDTIEIMLSKLYEDDPHHNCVFVGLDENGEARHAHLRSTGSQGKVFRINVESSDIKHSFHKNGTDRSLYVFEAPIDLLSHITLYPAGWLEHSYVACCGTSIQPVLERLRQNPKLDTVYLCLDNDEAGEDACDGMLDTLEDMGYDVERLRPEGKDWNDDLRAKRGKAKTPTA